MYRLFNSEFQKIKWPIILVMIILEGVVTWALAAGNTKSLSQYFPYNWTTLYFQAVSFHGMFFLPLFTGIFATYLCFYEHKNGAWKQLLTLPYPRWKILLSKFLTLITLIAFMQVLFLAGYLITGNIIHVEGLIPQKSILQEIAGGWLACFPIAMLQIWLATRFQSFGIALLICISSVIPNIVLTGLPASLGAWFPFTAPYYAMFPQGLPLSPRMELIPFILILVFTFFVYLICSVRSFVHKDWI
ncbi:ABC transporter permease [Paenibacillus sanguinis]|uniref:ABC transporter permease n=1 Tax=Paenibacillus sanguinis TaxID=225906 RepID=UPI0003753182|nr:ABC transporter permease [Paenibacillus sanguinis]